MTDALKKKLVTLEGLQEFYNTALPGGVVNGETDHYVTSPSGTAGSSSTNRTQWTGTVTGISALYTGLKVMFKIPIAGVAAGCTLNINSLGEHPVVINANSTITTHYPVSSILPLIYDADLTASVTVNSAPTSYTGCWKVINYDSNSDTRVTQTATSTSANYEVLFSATANNTTLTEAARKNNNLLFNPSTGNLQTTKLNGVTIGSSPKFTDTLPAVSTTYSALKTLRNNSLLIPGQLYRITDYVTTTTQENTQSAGHAFDIIVVADDVNVLNENAYAALHSGDTYFTNAGAKLEAWQLKYTLDNKYWSLAPHGEQITNYGSVYEYEGTEEINSTTYYKWYRVDYTYQKRYTLGKSVGDTVYSYHSGSTLYENGTIDSYIPASDANGKGTIYWMKDEFNNECSYDFKNIQFKFTSAIENSGIIANVFYYTFSFASGDNDATITDHSLVKYCIRNKVIYMEEDNDKFKLPFNVFRCNSARARFTKNTIIGNNISNTFSSAQYNEIIGVSSNGNSFGEGCFNNKIYGVECSNNKFYEGCGSNSMIGESKSNVLGKGSYGNKFDGGRLITLGERCEFNTFESGCYKISLGEYCRYNTFGISCYNITFGTSESTKSYCRYIIVENGNQYIYLDCSATTSYSAYFQNVKIAQGVNNTNTYKTITHTTAGDTFQTIYKPINSVEVSV